MTWPRPASAWCERVVIEAEVKARVRDPDRVRALLRLHAAERLSRYYDTYFDRPGRPLTQAGRELRLRVVDEGGHRRSLLTCKAPAVDEQTGSKPETEIEVSDAGATDQILLALGFTHLVAFEKNCANYAFTLAGRDILATLVTVPELDGTFIEVETLTSDPGDVGSAVADVRAVLGELGIASTDLTTELYTEAVMQYGQKCI
jgi:adenylate cyclase class 2